MPDLAAPHREPDRGGSDRCVNGERFAEQVPGAADRKLIEIGGVVGVDLLAPLIQALVTRPLPVQQADADQGQLQIAGRLQVISGEDPEPAGVDRQRLGDRELHREVADQDRSRLQHRQRRRPPPPLLQGGQRTLHLVAYPLAAERRRDPVRPQPLEHQDRVVIALVPEAGIERREGGPHTLIPAPGEIERQRFQFGEHAKPV